MGSYNKQHRDASIKADLNKLYDTRPTSGSLINDAYAKTQQQKSSNMQDIGGGRQNNNNDGDSNEQIPYFDLNHSGNVTGVLGKTALLNCRVKNIGNKTVSTHYKK